MAASLAGVEAAGKPAAPAGASGEAEKALLPRLAVLSKVAQESRASYKKVTKVREYVRSRGLDPGQLDGGYIGPELGKSWNAPLKESALKLWILRKSRNHTIVPAFRYCLVLFLKNKQGQVSGLYGRAVQESAALKHLYLSGPHQGLYPAYPKEGTRRLILTESILDAATLQTREMVMREYAVLALYGTGGFTAEHGQAIGSLQALEEVVLWFDGDAAGRAATRKIAAKLDALRPGLRVTAVPTPEGEDLNSLGQGHDGGVFARRLQQRQPVLLSTEKETRHASAPEGGQSSGMEVGTLDASDPEKLLYHSAHLQAVVWGGVASDSLHRLKVNLYLQKKGDAFKYYQDDVNLYSNPQLQRYVRGASEELEMSSTLIKQSIYHLKAQLEHYRMQKREREQQALAPRDHPMSTEEERQALALLKDKQLVKRTMELIGGSETGQLTKKRLHSMDGSTFAQQINYSYNARGWLRHTTSPLFAEELRYTEGTSKQYNGNIAYQVFTRHNTASPPALVTETYSYTYDKLDRLLKGTLGGSRGMEELSYDRMGNIQNLKRSGTTSALVDNLSYTYSGNRLSSITDAASSNTQSPYQLPGTTSYSYDENGNLLSRSNAAHTGNNITSTSYNILNLPRQVVTPSGTISYTYDATGNKLRSVGAQAGQTRDYIDGIEYSGGMLELIHTEEGRIVKSGSNYLYEYLLKDHLGNNRVGFRQGEASVPNFSTDYYPFGLQYQARIRQSSPKNNYLYNGKELQESLMFFDYGARFYDPVIGRFTTIDRLSEQYYGWSQYQYAANNPIKFIDVNGDSINVAHIQRYDQQNGTNIMDAIITDLNTQTGLTFSVTNSGQLVFQLDDKGNAIITTATDKKGNTTPVGSQKARDIMTSTISTTDQAYVQITSGRSSVPGTGSPLIRLSPGQINSFITGANNVNGRTMGWGMTFMHETLHSNVGGGLKDSPRGAGFGPIGAVETRMNQVRRELNKQGFNYGQRSSYQALGISGQAYLPFDNQALQNLNRGLIPGSSSMFIKF